MLWLMMKNVCLKFEINSSIRTGVTINNNFFFFKKCSSRNNYENISDKVMNLFTYDLGDDEICLKQIP